MGNLINFVKYLEERKSEAHQNEENHGIIIDKKELEKGRRAAQRGLEILGTVNCSELSDEDREKFIGALRTGLQQWILTLPAVYSYLDWHFNGDWSDVDLEMMLSALEPFLNLHP